MEVTSPKPSILVAYKPFCFLLFFHFSSLSLARRVGKNGEGDERKKKKKEARDEIITSHNNPLKLRSIILFNEKGAIQKKREEKKEVVSDASL